MTRGEAIDLLVRRDFSQLSNDEREGLLLDWWAIDASDPDYGSLPDILKETIARADQPDDLGDSLYDPLLKIALRRGYVGVLNSYLMSQIAILGRCDAVDGRIEDMALCPCCGYRSLRENGAYEICRVCFWEDDGTTESDCVSSPNHMTLRDARQNLQRFGAVTESAQQHVLIDGRKRYASAST